LVVAYDEVEPWITRREERGEREGERRGREGGREGGRGGGRGEGRRGWGVEASQCIGAREGGREGPRWEETEAPETGQQTTARQYDRLLTDCV
jgi:hypothetical protein